MSHYDRISSQIGIRDCLSTAIEKMRLENNPYDRRH